MINTIIKLLLILLIVFTPIAFGAMEVWAFSLMELGILLIILLWAVQSSITATPGSSKYLPSTSEKNRRFLSSRFEICNLKFAIPFVLLSLFLVFVLFQLLPLPSGFIKIISPKTYALRQSLSIPHFGLSAMRFGPAASKFPLSFLPFFTQIEFFKWLTLTGLFAFLLSWKSLEQGDRTIKQLILTVMAVGIMESLYGIFEFFSGQQHILHLEAESPISSVTGTFINRNYFAGYLLMVIPLGIGFLFSRENTQRIRFRGWRERLISLDGKTLLIGFSLIVMILGLLFSASRMGILSLLLSFSLSTFLFRKPDKGKRYSKTILSIFSLALLWAVWIGLDAVISRFFSTTEDFKFRWAMWVSTFEIFKDFPIFGSGLGSFIQAFPMHRSLHIQGLATHAENDYLQLASDVGLLGTGLLLVTFLFLLWKGVSEVRSMPSEERRRYIAIGSLVGILALMLHSLVERNIQVPSNAFLYTILWAIVLKVPMTRQEPLSNNQAQG